MARLVKLAGRRVNDAGELVIDARTHRSRQQNRQEARDRLSELIRRAMIVPRTRRPTRPTAGARRRRIESKRRRSITKQQRRDGHARCDHHDQGEVPAGVLPLSCSRTFEEAGRRARPVSFSGLAKLRHFLRKIRRPPRVCPTTPARGAPGFR